MLVCQTIKGNQGFPELFTCKLIVSLPRRTRIHKIWVVVYQGTVKRNSWELEGGIWGRNTEMLCLFVRIYGLYGMDWIEVKSSLLWLVIFKFISGQVKAVHFIQALSTQLRNWSWVIHRREECLCMLLGVTYDQRGALCSLPQGR